VKELGQKLKTIVASVTVAMVLGVLVMVVPILTYGQFFAAIEGKERGGENLLRPLATEAGNDTKSATLGTVEEDAQTRGEEEFTVGASSLETLDEAAQAYGKMDAGPSPFSSSLFHALLLIAAGLVAGLGFSLYSKRKMRLS